VALYVALDFPLAAPTDRLSLWFPCSAEIGRKAVGLMHTLRERLAFRSWYTDKKIAEINGRLDQIRLYASRAAMLEKERYVAELLSAERYRDPRRLESHGFKVYSQNDEDGIIAEIFRRIGSPARTFVEFGVEHGLESNTMYLLLQGWRGLWIEGNEKSVAHIRSRFNDVIQANRLSVTHSFITRDNINLTIGSFAQGEIDLLSIDIDGNDYHIWEAVEIIRPRLVVIEHNSKFPPPISIAPAYAPHRVWQHDDYMGASLEAIVRLGTRKGYSLVGCNIIGINAFFVRDDLVEDKFAPPFTDENHYHPPRYFLSRLYTAGHKPTWGQYVEVSQ
jgi:hypothetical protein